MIKGLFRRYFFIYLLLGLLGCSTTPKFKTCKDSDWVKTLTMQALKDHNMISGFKEVVAFDVEVVMTDFKNNVLVELYKVKIQTSLGKKITLLVKNSSDKFECSYNGPLVYSIESVLMDNYRN